MNVRGADLIPTSSGQWHVECTYCAYTSKPYPTFGMANTAARLHVRRTKHDLRVAAARRRREPGVELVR